MTTNRLTLIAILALLLAHIWRVASRPRYTVTVPASRNGAPVIARGA